MPGGQLHVVFRKHSPFFTNLGQKYGPRSFQVNLIGHVALLTNHVFTSSRYCAGSSSGNCNWSSDELTLELPTSSRSILTVFLSESSSWPCKCIISTAARKLRLYAFSRLRDYNYGYLHTSMYMCTRICTYKLVIRLSIDYNYCFLTSRCLYTAYILYRSMNIFGRQQRKNIFARIELFLVPNNFHEKSSTATAFKIKIVNILIVIASIY